MIKKYLFAFFMLAGQLSIAQEMERYEFSAPKMGTTFRVVVYAKDSIQVAAAVSEAFQRVDQLNQIMSDYDLTSELNQLSEEAAADTDSFYPVSKDLWNVLRLAQRVARQSKGAFDITVGPLSKLWRRAFRRQTFPQMQALEQARAVVNYKWLKLRPRDQSVRLKRAGMRLDLGGIAKGYAVDAVYSILQGHGMNHALVDGGGDIYVGDPPPGETDWRVSRYVLRGDSLVNAIILLKNSAIATSGDTYKFLEWEGKRYAHLINPKTGLGMTDRRMVTVEAPNCMLADAMASTFSVLELRKIKQLARRFDATCNMIFKVDNGAWKQI